jgi:hypothetical protein
MNVEQMVHEGILYAIIIRKHDVELGVKFYTPDDNPMQVGQQLRLKGTVIKPHVHCTVESNLIGYLQETIHIQSGKLKTIFYTDEGRKITERILESGDTILLIRGGHGFEALDDVRLLEIKMGPYDPASKKNLEETA